MIFSVSIPSRSESLSPSASSISPSDLYFFVPFLYHLPPPPAFNYKYHVTPDKNPISSQAPVSTHYLCVLATSLANCLKIKAGGHCPWAGIFHRVGAAKPDHGMGGPWFASPASTVRGSCAHGLSHPALPASLCLGQSPKKAPFMGQSSPKHSCSWPSGAGSNLQILPMGLVAQMGLACHDLATRLHT